MTVPRPPGGGELPAALRVAVCRDAWLNGSTVETPRLDYTEAAWPAVEREVLEAHHEVAALRAVAERVRAAREARLPAPPTPAEVEAAVRDIRCLQEAARVVEVELGRASGGRCKLCGAAPGGGHYADDSQPCPFAVFEACLDRLARIRWADTLVAGRYRAALEVAEHDAQYRKEEYGGIHCRVCGVQIADYTGENCKPHAPECPFALLSAPPPAGWEALAELPGKLRDQANRRKSSEMACPEYAEGWRYSRLGGRAAGERHKESALMATKATDKTLKKVGDDEPIFVLRAQDELAPRVIGYWCALAAIHGAPASKIGEADRLSKRMALWAAEHGSKVPD